MKVTYAERRIAQKQVQNAEYRATFEEEEVLLAKDVEIRALPTSHEEKPKASGADIMP